MVFLEGLNKTISDYFQGDYEVIEIDKIPSVDDVQFGKIAYKAKVATLYIDMRNSTDLLYFHQKQTAGKIHKSFLYACSKAIRYYGGNIRSFNGDSVLALWPAYYKNEITACVKSSMVIKWLLDVELSKFFEKYEKLDFGIGIDWGEVFIARAGLQRDANNNDLIFLGKSVNFAVAIGEQARSPYHVEVSLGVYNNLEENLILSNKDGEKVNMWTDGKMSYRDKEINTKLTSWYWYLERV